jgi:hypothetical protein
MITDHQLALELGNRIISLYKKNAALHALCSEYMESLPWQSLALSIEQNDHIVRVAGEQEGRLLQAISGEKDASSLIRALHQEFVE